MIENRKIPDKLFVTGTDTDVGKTVVSAALCKGLKAGYWKPVQAGREPATDTERVKMMTSHDNTFFYRERYCLKLPMSPHAASEKEDIKIELEDFNLPEYQQEKLIVEGAGGIMVPINRKHMILDMIKLLDLPVLLVARSGLGTINHTLLSIEILKRNDVKLWGVVLNGPKHLSNEDAIRFFGGVKNLFSLPRLQLLTPESLQTAFIKTFSQNEG